MAVVRKLDFSKAIAILQSTKSTLPVKVANDARKHFVGAFTKQQFDGSTWKEVKRRIPGTDEYKYPKRKGLGRRTRPILVGRGKLRREVNNSIRKTTWNEIRLGISDATPYAEAHNNGSKKKNIPRRRFMGDSKELHKQIRTRIATAVGGIFK